MTFNAPLFLLLAGLCMLPGLQAQRLGVFGDIERIHAAHFLTLH